MSFTMHLIIALISIIAIVLACMTFTESIEHLGKKFNLGNNATGSILAVIGTGLPETIVPIIAIFSSYFSNIQLTTAQDIAHGAIIGSPFILSTLVLFILGLILLFKKQNKLNINHKDILRDCRYFFIAYLFSFLFYFEAFKNYKFIAPILLIALYFIFTYRTIKKEENAKCENGLCKLLFQKFIKNYNLAIFSQIIVSLIILSISTHFFVSEIKHFSHLLNISPLILSLLITPIATELPECINSIIWLKQDKDELALANIFGAIVFQATIVFSIGITLTNWIIDRNILINSIIMTIFAIIFSLSILIQKKINALLLVICGLLYFVFLVFIL